MGSGAWGGVLRKGVGWDVWLEGQCHEAPFALSPANWEHRELSAGAVPALPRQDELVVVQPRAAFSYCTF